MNGHFCKTLSPPQTRIPCAKFGYNWASGAGQDDFVMNFAITVFLSFQKGMALHMNKLQCSSSKNVFCQVGLKLTQWLCKRRLLNVVDVYFAILFLSSIGKKHELPFKQLEFFHPRMFFLKIR